MITLPRDDNHLIYLQGTRTETIFYADAEYRIDARKAMINDVNYVDVEKGDLYCIFPWMTRRRGCPPSGCWRLADVCVADLADCPSGASP